MVCPNCGRRMYLSDGRLDCPPCRLLFRSLTHSPSTRATPHPSWQAHLRRGVRSGLRWLALGTIVAFLLLGTACGLFAMLLVLVPPLTSSLGSALGLSLLCGVIPLLFLLTIVCHEAGHLLGGWMAGLSPRFARVGPITLVRERAGWRLRWDSQNSWLGGYAECQGRAAERWRMILFLLAGPATNLLCGLLAGFLIAAPLPALLRGWLGLFAILSLFYGSVNLLPFREQHLNSDGLALLRLLRQKPHGPGENPTI